MGQDKETLIFINYYRSIENEKERNQNPKKSVQRVLASTSGDQPADTLACVGVSHSLRVLRAGHLGIEFP